MAHDIKEIILRTLLEVFVGAFLEVFWGFFTPLRS